MKKIFESKKLVIGLVVLAVVLIALKVNDFNLFISKKYGHFEKFPDMNVARARHNLFMLKDGRVLILGGDFGIKRLSKLNSGRGERDLKTAEIFDPKTGKYIMIKGFHEVRYAFNAIMLDDGKILITGGEGKRTPQSSLIYDPIQDKSTKGPEMHFARSSHSSIKFKDGRVLVFGGFTGKAGVNKLFNIAEIYDPKLNKFLVLKNSPNFNYYNPAHTCLLSDGKVFIVNALKENNKAEIFDPKTNKFKILNIPLTNDSNEFYYYLSGIVPLKNDKIVLFENTKDDLNNIKILDLKANKLTNIGHTNLKARKGCALTLLKNGNILISGGSVGSEGAHRLVNSAEIFDTKSLKFYNLPKMSYKKQAPQAILLDNGSVFINGGFPDFNGTRAMTSEIFIPNNNN